MDYPAHLITTKVLRPRRREDLLYRRRLVNFIHAQIDRKLIILSAPAGYGKTSLLVDYTHHTGLPVCWYALDEHDSDPRVFLEYLVASIRRHFPTIGQRINAILHSDESHLPDADTIASALVNDIIEEINEHFVIVLDDYHLIDDTSEVHHILDRLLHYLPDHCHIILASRTLPPLTLTRLVAHQEVDGLGVDDLRFTAPEIQQLMQQNYGIELPEEKAQEMAERLDGWIAGLLLTKHNEREGLFADMIRTQGETQVFEFLANEIFKEQPRDIQKFLLHSAILDQISPAICNELLNIEVSEEILHYLESQNLFIFALEGPGSWYRYHQLFREFLRSHLRATDPQGYKRLNLKAARLFVSRNETAQAIQHYLEAEAYEEAAGVIEAVADDTFNAGHWTTLAHWIDALPREVLLQQPRLMIHRAKVWIQIGQLTDAIRELDQAIKTLKENEAARELHAEALTFKSIALRIQGHYSEAINLCQQALTLLGDDESPIAAQAYRNIGIVYGMQGKLLNSAEQLSQALRLYENFGEVYHIASLQHDLATTYMRTGDLARAFTYYRQALRHWRETENAARIGETLNGMACALYYQGDHKAARELLEEALTEAHKAQYTRLEAAILAGLGDIASAAGQYDEALSYYEKALNVAEDIGEETIIVYVLNAMGHTHSLLGQYNRAWICVKQALTLAEERGSVYDIGLTQDTLGVLYQKRSELDTAIRHFTEARNYFNVCGAKRELAITNLHLAQTLFEKTTPNDALSYLKETLDLVEELGYDHFLVAESKRSVDLFKHAVAHEAGNGRLTRILVELGEEVPTAQPASPAAPAQVAEPEPELRIYALRQAQVWLGDQQITRKQWDSATTKELFFFLLAHPEGVRKDKILEIFWPDAPPNKASSAFHSTNYRLRRALNNPDVILFNNGVYSINPELRYWYDVEEFQKFIEQARQAPSIEEAAAAYLEAIALYKSNYLEEFYSDWPYFQREELQRAYFEALMNVAEYYRQIGRAEEALPLYERIVTEDPYREEIHREIMKVYVECGQRAAAINHYLKFKAFLEEDLNVDPMPETTLLYESILGNKDKIG